MKPPSLVILCSVACAVILAWPLARYTDSTGRAAAALHRRDAMVRDATEVEQLRALRPAISAGKRPQPNVYAHVTDALVESGLPAQLLKEVAPGEDGSVSVEGSMALHRRQSMRVAFEPLTLPQLGQFLAVWRMRQPEWTCTTIQVTPVAERSAKTSGVLRPLRVAMVMEATYLEMSEGASFE